MLIVIWIKNNNNWNSTIKYFMIQETKILRKKYVFFYWITYVLFPQKK